MYTQFQGGTFQFVGQVGDENGPFDLTNCQLSASVFDPTGQTLIASLSVAIIGPPLGIVQVSFPDTSAWPIGKARIDAKLVTLAGEIIYSQPAYFRIAQSPLL